jgi:serine protease Do
LAKSLTFFSQIAAVVFERIFVEQKYRKTMRTKQIIQNILIAVAGGLLAVALYARFFKAEVKVITRESRPVEYARYVPGADSGPCDMTYAAEKTVQAVVHVKTQTVVERAFNNPIYEFFYGRQYHESEPVMGFGSGVIISPDGYIVTNNHVIENSKKITVVLNDNREFEAKLVATDPSTDLAVIRINAKDLSFIPFGNSEELRLGQWVLAVGNPFNLTSTVTGGIISAKGRNLGILQDQYRIESFIQTDAALNPGNSGGALVNLRGELVGINTAIISPSGGYAGNSFAIPVSIVKKVVEDLIQFGTVQRGILGVDIHDVTSDLARDKGLDEVEGVYISGLRDNSGAKDAGIKEGDVITKVNDVKVNSMAELQEQVSKYHPGDKLNVVIKRKDAEKQFIVTLRNMQGTTGVVKKEEVLDVLDAKLAIIGPEVKSKMGIKNGVRIVSVGHGKFASAGVSDGFIIISINNSAVNTPNDVKRIMNTTKGGVYIEGVYPDGTIAYYAFGL